MTSFNLIDDFPLTSCICGSLIITPWIIPWGAAMHSKCIVVYGENLTYACTMYAMSVFCSPLCGLALLANKCNRYIRAVCLVLLTAVGMYVHFPKHVCEHCRRSPYLSTRQTELQPLHLPETEHSNSTETRFSNPHSTVTTETTPLILHASKVGPSQ